MSKFQKVIDRVEHIKANPPIDVAPAKILWRLNLSISILTSEPPNTYPTALEIKTNE